RPGPRPHPRPPAAAPTPPLAPLAASLRARREIKPSVLGDPTKISVLTNLLVGITFRAGGRYGLRYEEGSGDPRHADLTGRLCGSSRREPRLGVLAFPTRLAGSGDRQPQSTRHGRHRPTQLPGAGFPLAERERSDRRHHELGREGGVLQDAAARRSHL